MRDSLLWVKAGRGEDADGDTDCGDGKETAQKGNGPMLHKVLRASDEMSLDKLPEGCSVSNPLGLGQTQGRSHETGGGERRVVKQSPPCSELCALVGEIQVVGSATSPFVSILLSLGLGRTRDQGEHTPLVATLQRQKTEKTGFSSPLWFSLMQ